MHVHIPYGKDNVRIEIDIPCEIVVPNEFEIDNENEIISKALSEPLGKGSFSDFTKKAEHLLVIVNDSTRPNPTTKVLDHLYQSLSRHPDVTFLIATGAHRAPTGDELGSIFGEFYNEFKDSIRIHDAQRDEEMVYIGRTTRGTEVRLNRLVVEADGIITISNVKSHYFAGFTGGPKSFLPGIAAYETIEMNHSHALSQAAQPMVLKGNPVAQDIREAAGLLKNSSIFSIQIVMNGNHKVYAAAAGDLFESFNTANIRSMELYSAALKAKGNIVLTANQYPMDINLYQAQHALENSKLALDHPGILILVSKCWEGIGSPAFLELLDRVVSQEDVERILEKGYKLGYHKAARIMRMKRYAELWAVTDLNESVVRRAKMTPYHNIQKAIDDAIEHVESRGMEARAVVMPNGGMTVPIMEYEKD